MTLYNGVRQPEVMETVYKQGVKGSRGDVKGAVDTATDAPELKLRNPGRPEKRTSPKRS